MRPSAAAGFSSRQPGGAISFIAKWSAMRTSRRGRSVGLKGFEPLTLRLSSACSNQLSYRPGRGGSAADVKSDR